MRALGFDVKKDQVLKILKDYDRENTGKITFDDFNEVSKYITLTVSHNLSTALKINNLSFHNIQNLPSQLNSSCLY